MTERSAYHASESVTYFFSIFREYCIPVETIVVHYEISLARILVRFIVRYFCLAKLLRLQRNDVFSISFISRQIMVCVGGVHLS